MIVILGPTGIGKTRLAIELAKELQTEILSADSRQFYRELKIGTATPTPAELSEAKHHFIGHISIHDYYNASMFEQEALGVLQKIFVTKNTVILTGGSGLYINALCKGIDELPKVDQAIRKQLQLQYKEMGLEYLHKQLLKLDPVHYNQVDLNNPKRILKALEVCIITGKPYSSFLTLPKKTREFSILKIGLNMDRAELYQKINQRVDEMMEYGLLKEAKELYHYKQLNALNTVGYKELFEYFQGVISLEKAVELIKRNTRHYAKRQLTWFARDNEIKWFSPFNRKKIFAHIQSEIFIQ